MRLDRGSGSSFSSASSPASSSLDTLFHCERFHCACVPVCQVRLARFEGGMVFARTSESSLARASRLSISVSSGLLSVVLWVPLACAVTFCTVMCCTVMLVFAGTTVCAVWLRRFGRFEGGTSTSDSSLARASSASKSVSAGREKFAFRERERFLGKGCDAVALLFLVANDLIGQV